MKRSKLKNLFDKNKNQENCCKYKVQRNYSYIKQRFIINSYKNLDIKEVTDNKKFWKNVKSDFGKGDSNSEKILLLENNLIITNEKEIATIMNNFSLISRKNLDSMSSKKYATKDR